MTHKPPSLFDWNIVGPALVDSFRKLDPRLMIKNPVMFVTMVGAALTTVGIVTSSAERGFITQLAIWLWFTVLFANFAEAVAEGRGKAQADTLRKARKDTMARRLRNGREERVPAPELQKGDLVVCEAGEVIPADGEVIEGIASVDEAAITGESAPVIRESGGDRSAVTGGTRATPQHGVVCDEARALPRAGSANLRRFQIPVALRDVAHVVRRSPCPCSLCGGKASARLKVVLESVSLGPTVAGRRCNGHRQEVGYDGSDCGWCCGGGRICALR